MYKYIHKLFRDGTAIHDFNGLFKPLDNLCLLIEEDNFPIPINNKRLIQTSIMFDALSLERENKPEGDHQTYHDLRVCNKLAASLSEENACLITCGEREEMKTFLAENPKYAPLDEFLEDFFDAIMWDCSIGFEEYVDLSVN